MINLNTFNHGLIKKVTEMSMHKRFRGFLPIVIDVETSGLNSKKNAILEAAALSLVIKPENNYELAIESTWHEHFKPFSHAVMDPEALRFNKIDPFHPLRFAQEEKKCIEELNDFVKEKLKEHKCKRAILVGHNSWFDLHFLNAAYHRNQIESPFHKFSSIDTASIGAIFYGQTVLAELLKLTKISYAPAEAHSALYDATKTAELFCRIANDLRNLAINNFNA